MSGITPVLPAQVLRAWPLHGVAASRDMEARGLADSAPHALMQAAGQAVARLALAVAPHAQRVWVACGPGNNGGDGLVAATQLHRAGRRVNVTLLGDATRLPADAANALQQAQAAQVPITSTLASPPDADLAIDALLGLGAARAPQGDMALAIAALNALSAPVLAVDLPSGLHAERGQPLGGEAVRATHTLALLGLKPGLFTGRGRDHAGHIWLDSLGQDLNLQTPSAWLWSPTAQTWPLREHQQHKGSFGDVVVLGGAPGMGGAALLAGRAALAAGAGRVLLGALDPTLQGLVDTQGPELMPRTVASLLQVSILSSSTVVCGCGGGQAVRAVLPAVLHHAARLVLDADALNAVAADDHLRRLLHARAGSGRASVVTPHPLEAARLLGCDAAAVQADRLGQAQALAESLQATVVLKGSGSVIASPGQVPAINPTGNARLATAGSGDVLAGWLGGHWSSRHATSPHDVACACAWLHGRAAEGADTRLPLRAADLADAMRGALPSWPA
ncbi:yjeF-like protein [Burkholderiales bacterium JOSHI_001]|nr:yjeF-like protein [Burkholderiales bacterium JOSHI_001]